MKYTYSLTIIDENGEIKGERELSAEQAIDILLAPESVEVAEVEPEPETETVPERAPAPKKKDKKPKVEAPAKSGGRFPLKACCGSVGPRHKHGCASAAKPKEGKRDSLELSGPAALTEEQYGDLRGAMHDFGFSSREYASEMDLPLSQVNAAIKSTDYENYLASR